MSEATTAERVLDSVSHTSFKAMEEAQRIRHLRQSVENLKGALRDPRTSVFLVAEVPGREEWSHLRIRLDDAAGGAVAGGLEALAAKIDREWTANLRTLKADLQEQIANLDRATGGEK